MSRVIAPKRVVANEKRPVMLDPEATKWAKVRMQLASDQSNTPAARSIYAELMGRSVLRHHDLEAAQMVMMEHSQTQEGRDDLALMLATFKPLLDQLSVLEAEHERLTQQMRRGVRA